MENAMANASRSVHRTAEQGFSAAADSFVRGRPDYPPELADWLRKDLGLGPGTKVVDLGAGTGKFTPRLLETGAHVIAVEPVEKMLDKLAAALPQVDALEGRATAIPLPDASVDAVVCAQAFHWFATAEALAEIRRVLKPGGKLGLVWNVRDERVGWVARFGEIVNRLEGDTPRYHHGAWRKVFPCEGFGPLNEQHFGHVHRGDPEDVIITRAKSVSFIAALAPERREEVVEELRALIAGEAALRGQAEVEFPYETAAFYVVKVAE
jgi:SAM-dependent methyltransferase